MSCAETRPLATRRSPMFTNAPCIAESTLCEPYVRSQPRQYAKWVNEPANRVKLLKIACKTMPAAPVENSIRLALSELTEAAHPEFSLWRREGDSNPRYGCPYAGFRIRCFRPLSHLSKVTLSQGVRPILRGQFFHSNFRH